MSGPPPTLEVNVDDLFAKLVAVGILKGNSKKEDSPAPQEPAMKKELEKIPPLSFQKVDMLKVYAFCFVCVTLCEAAFCLFTL